MREWRVEAPRQPLRRITSAALPVKAAYFTERTPSAKYLARVDFPVPAQPKSRNTCGPLASLSQAETARRASSCCGDQIGIKSYNQGQTYGLLGEKNWKQNQNFYDPRGLARLVAGAANGSSG